MTENKQFILGCGLLILGSVALVVPMPTLSKIVYPILWWGLILVLDAINFWQWKESPLISSRKNFFGVIIPLSVLYWLYFELVNFYFPQWYYVDIIEGVLSRTLLALASFATVIPAVVEIFWLFNGSLSKIEFSTKPQKSLFYFLLQLAGLVFALMPFFGKNFVLNQFMWLAPFLILFPFLKTEMFKTKSLLYIPLSGLISGFLWEFLNFGAVGKWKYLILPDAPHLFEMPMAGYLGFIPFAFSTLAVYLVAIRLPKPQPHVVAVLYAAALYASYLFALSFQN